MSKIDWDNLDSDDWPFSGPNLLNSELFAQNTELEWHGKVVEQLCRAMLPSVDLTELEDGREATARNAGAALGTLHETFGQFSKLLDREKDSRSEAEETLLRALEIITSGASSEDYQALRQNLEEVEEIVKEATSRVLDEKPKEAGQFFAGFGREASAIEKEPDPLHLPRETNATQIHLLLLTFGVVAQKTLFSLREFYDFLEATQRDVHLGDFERFRKVCNRVGFSIGKPGQSSKRDIEEIKLTVLEGLQEANTRPDEKNRSS